MFAFLALDGFVYNHRLTFKKTTAHIDSVYDSEVGRGRKETTKQSV